jgi:serine protease Do
MATPIHIMDGMSRRFLAAVVCLSATVGVLLGLVVAGSLTPASAVSSPARQPERPGPRLSSPVAAAAVTPLAVPSFADIAQRLNPAVVNIDATSRSSAGASRRPRTQLPDAPDLFEPPLERDRDGYRRGAGAGFLIDRDGHILTNQHVVADASRLIVRLADGRRLRATHVGSDPDTDIALLKVEAAGPLPFAPLGDSDRLRVGEWVVAIGNPLAYEHTVTVGIVSFIGRKLFNSALDRYIQTDAAINFGNSGGPLIDARGEVVGINSAISSRASNIGFAVPINQAIAILPQLREEGRVSRGYIGIGLRDVDPDLQQSLRLRTAQGALVQDVTPGSPGERAGVQPYDLVVAVDGRAISGNDQLIALISARRPGTRADLHVLRDDRAITIPVKLAERPQRASAPSGPDAAERPRPSGPGVRVGMSVRALDDDFRTRARLPDGMQGVIVSRVDPIGPASDARIERGYLLLEIDRQPVRSLDDYERAIAGARTGDLLALYLYNPETLQRTLHTLRLDW